jgi:hypothetical protein
MKIDYYLSMAIVAVGGFIILVFCLPVGLP